MNYVYCKSYSFKIPLNILFYNKHRAAIVFVDFSHKTTAEIESCSKISSFSSFRQVATLTFPKKIRSLHKTLHKSNNICKKYDFAMKQGFFIKLYHSSYYINKHQENSFKTIYISIIFNATFV